MVLQPRLLLVYVVIFLVFNPEDISAKLLSDQTPNLDFLKSWLPEKETLKKGEDEGTALVQFDEKIIDKEHESSYTHQMEQLVRYLGKNYTMIILHVSHSKFEASKKSLTTLFLQAISTENRIRHKKSINPIKAYIQISIKFFLDTESLSEIQFLINGLVNLITHQGNIHGLIFDASLIQIPVQLGAHLNKTIHTAVYPSIKTFKTYLKTLEPALGYKLKLGLSVNSLMECEFVMTGLLADTVSLFDMVVYTYSEIDICQRKEEAKGCIELFRNKFPSISFQQIEGLFGINTK